MLTMEQWTRTSSPSLPPIILYGKEDICFTRSKVLDYLRPPGGKKERTTLILTQQSTVSSKPQRLLCAKPIILVERLPLSKAQQMTLIDPQKSLELLATDCSGAANTPKAGLRLLWQNSKAQRERTGRVLFSFSTLIQLAFLQTEVPDVAADESSRRLDVKSVAYDNSRHGYPLIPSGQTSQAPAMHLPPRIFSFFKILQIEFSSWVQLR